MPDTLTRDAVIPAKDPQSSSLLRYWGDTTIAQSEGWANRDNKNDFRVLDDNQEVNFLTLSGGGYNGAFGTGYLLGWTNRGDRPDFQVVTGISVGALIAPFAFLGAEYDQDLLDAFKLITADYENGRGVLGVILGASSVESNAPIERAIARIITAETIVEIGKLHKTGRRLLIGTTNLDVQRPVIWDIGAIATSEVPNKVELVRDIILASTAVPGIYPPVLIKVEADGKEYDELHVDGGVTQQIVLIPENLNLRATNPKTGERLKRQIYVIYNGKVVPDYEPVKITAIDILFRSIPTFIKSLGRADVTRLRTAAEKYGASYQLVSMPADATIKNDFTPDPAYLDTLIKLGFEMGTKGIWQE